MSYPRFEAFMDQYPGLSWEPIEVTTSDDYILTMFRLWDPDTYDSANGPILFQHGAGMDGTNWLDWNDTPAPQIHFADLGHDIYVANQRGTDYSQQHTTLDPSTDAEQYWDFTFENMAEDVLAFTEGMFNKSGVKGWYFGFS